MKVKACSKQHPGYVRDAILGCLGSRSSASVSEICSDVAAELGEEAFSASSVRSYLRLNVGTVFEKKGRGQYSLLLAEPDSAYAVPPAAISTFDESPAFEYGRSKLYSMDCIDWLKCQAAKSIHGVVTDPPYSLLEYSQIEQQKLRSGRGGVWRIPPSFDGHQRGPLPRFTVLKEEQLDGLMTFFRTWAEHLLRVLVPGAQVVIASNPLLSYRVSYAISEAGFERRGEIARLVMTMRGGDRPKNAHLEFNDVSVMPRSMWEPWLVFRKPLEGRVQDNLRKWGTGGFRRISENRPFGDVIRSHPTRKAERSIAGHPSLKPQAFLRQVVRAVLPLGRGIVLDPFAGSGSTLAAAENVGYESVGVELDRQYVELARTAIPRLSYLRVVSDTPSSF